MSSCDIIIPIFNAYDDVIDCINTVINNTNLHEDRLILINDCSPDERIDPLLNEVQMNNRELNIITLKNETNLGFVGTVNKGMKYSDRDVLLLNSDTEVPAHWLDRLKECAYSDDMIATVTALSNNATLVSVPNGLQRNEIPSPYNFEEYADIVAKSSFKAYPNLPTAHGFCLFIKRTVLDEVGFFDEETFGKGYGEENDFSFRCLDFGYRNVACDNVYVLHKESKSFLSEKTDLQKAHSAILNKRYPAYNQKIDLWCKQFPISYIGKNLVYYTNLANKKNILFLVHDFDDLGNNLGGTTMHCIDLIKSLNKEYNFHVLYPSKGLFKIHSFFYKEEQILTFKGLDNPSRLSYYNEEYRELVKKIVKGLNIDVVHIHHIMGQYFDIVDVCKENGIKSIMSLHDFHCICPTINLLYNMEEYCENVENKDCQKCLFNKIRLTNNIVPVWQKRWAKFLGQIDLVITPSMSTKQIVERHYHSINCKDIEHGINIKKINGKHISSDLETFNIAFVGVMAKHKGAEIVEYLVKNSKDSGIKYHLFGFSEYDSLVHNKKNYENHGKYKRDDLPKLLKDNNIHLVCNLSIWPETYSYTLTETIASGIPVLAFDLGAIGERINKYKFGWTLELNSGKKGTYQKIIDIKNDVNDYNSVIDNINHYQIKSLDEMIGEYREIYQKSEEHKFNDDYLKELINLDKQTSIRSSDEQLNEILNSRRWKLVSRIQVPKKVKKIARKIIK